jgi:CheY-like chemotaxis protein
MTTAAQGEADLRGASLGNGASVLQGKRILYVDDSPSVRFATSALLREEGATCLLAGTHEQAVMLAGREPELALAILDFQMPDGDVGGLVKRLWAERAGLPLIGTSGADRRNEFAARGVSQFLEKPWEIAELVRALEAANPRLRRHSMDPWISTRHPRD